MLLVDECHIDVNGRATHPIFEAFLRSYDPEDYEFQVEQNWSNSIFLGKGRCFLPNKLFKSALYATVFSIIFVIVAIMLSWYLSYCSHSTDYTGVNTTMAKLLIRRADKIV